jgi:hypothetical protein
MHLERDGVAARTAPATVQIFLSGRIANLSTPPQTGQGPTRSRPDFFSFAPPSSAILRTEAARAWLSSSSENMA